MEERRVLVIGNSDGIGLALTRRLLAEGWTVTGLSRSTSPIEDPLAMRTYLSATYGYA